MYLSNIRNRICLLLMTLTNLLLFLILVTLATYLFTPWKNMQKPPTLSILFQWLVWGIICSIIVVIGALVGIKI